MQLRIVALFVVYIILPVAFVPEKTSADASRWEAAIQAFEKQDAQHPPAKDGVLFVGSSSIRMWDLNKWFPKLNAINRGFGGSEVSDSVEFADRIILKYKPRVVVVYAGDNDLARKKSPQRVLRDYKQLVGLIHDELPKTKVVYIAVKPSIARWNLIEEVRKTNQLIAEYCSHNKQLVFIDIAKPMIGDDGMPREELFISDGLHLNDKGYRLWTSLVKPHLSQK